MAKKIYIPQRNGDRKKLKGCCLRWEQIKDAYEPSNGFEDWRKLHPKRYRRNGRLVCPWRKGRSAFELAVTWENASPGLPPEIEALFDSPAELLVATPEHTTPLEGKGRTSQTDVLAFVRAKEEKWVVAVEGKVDEGFGVPTCKWLKKGNPENRKNRLKGILDKLKLSCQEVQNIQYQLLHRTACAVIEAKRFNATHAAMIVHSFSQKQKPTGRGDFENLLCKMKVKSVATGKLHEVTELNIHPKISLFLGWVNS